MDGSLSKNSVLKAKASGEVQVEKLLGSGGQGEVYRVETTAGPMALKWYFPESATREQHDIINRLITIPVDDRRFLWPKDIVYGDRRDAFGYLMRLRPPQFGSLPDLFRRRMATTLRSLVLANLAIVEAYHELHSQGIAYRDISWGNVFFDPTTGDALVCDNDNAVFDGQEAAVQGTMTFMAPELVRSEARPSTQTDLHSLAVLLFMMLMNEHPLHGTREFRIHSMDAAAQRRLYGDDPLFMFDPEDDSNRPVRGVHDTAITCWDLIPQRLRRLFTDAFTAGLDNPDTRVREGQWRSAFTTVLDTIIYCAACNAQNYHDPDQFAVTRWTGNCWKCLRPLRLPPRLKVDRHVIMLNRDAAVYRHHVSDAAAPEYTEVVGAVSEHPSRPGVFGLTNRGDTDWTAEFLDGTQHLVAPGKTVTLKDRVRLQMCGAHAEFRTSAI